MDFCVRQSTHLFRSNNITLNEMRNKASLFDDSELSVMN